MSKIETGGPAFPPMHDPETHPSGATLRDYFAAAAMQGMVAQSESGGWPAEGIAKAAYRQADAMLAARKEES